MKLRNSRYLFGGSNITSKQRFATIPIGGNINLSGASSITWGNSSPVKYQFSVTGTGNWHNTMAENDKYRRDSLDGGITWGAAYQFRGTDGQNGQDGSDGSDADVNFNNILRALQTAASTKTTFITADRVGAPSIYGAKIYGAEIYAGGINEEGGQIVGLTDSGIDIWNGSGERVLTLKEKDGAGYIIGNYAYTTIDSNYINLQSTTTFFRGRSVDFTNVNEADFTGVTTKGLHLTFS